MNHTTRNARLSSAVDALRRADALVTELAAYADEDDQAQLEQLGQLVADAGSAVADALTEAESPELADCGCYADDPGCPHAEPDLGGRGDTWECGECGVGYEAHSQAHATHRHADEDGSHEPRWLP